MNDPKYSLAFGSEWIQNEGQEGSKNKSVSAIDKRRKNATKRHDIFVNCNWADTWWQQDSTQLHTNSTQNNIMEQNTKNGTYIITRTKKHNYKKTIRIHNLQN
jgi:hypothetical protein